VPIAIAYHLAHCFTFFLVQGQRIIPLVSDPFGSGLNVFGTAGYELDIGEVGALFARYTAVTAIAPGHIIAVRVAHVVALREFPDRRRATRSQTARTSILGVLLIRGRARLPRRDRRGPGGAADARPRTVEKTGLSGLWSAWHWRTESESSATLAPVYVTGWLSLRRRGPALARPGSLST
jgi:hypothetical protein